MDWHDTDLSDEEPHHDESQATSRKRSSRACDQCRKTKSKCEPLAGDSKTCKSCALTGTACTYLGPSYKRGPPKGYIHAIEQRWHQVEALLGAILQCPDPRVQSVASDLRQDDLAREILARVDSGPYGPSGRRTQRGDATKEDFFASILKSNESSQADSSRTRRQSRVSREIVSSNQDHGLSVVPTKEWQDNLAKRLAFGPSSGTSTRLPDDNGVPLSRRRRLNESNELLPTNWNDLYTIDPTPEPDDIKSASEGMGQLSLDENQEVRFHGQTSGLHLLGRSERTDDRIEGGIWRLPMARVWPPSKFGIETYPLGHTHVDMPPQCVQDELIELYFTNIHPVFPVIHKTRFLAEYRSRNQSEGQDFSSPSLSAGSTYSSPRPEPTQEVTRLLLFSMFAVAARFTERHQPHPRDNRMWDAGCNYLDSARKILNKVFHISRPSTVQSLLLLGYREFGIGSMEQGWIFIGTGIRMAFDIGLNCDSSKWKMHGHDLFSPEETQTRRQIWWACVLTDRYGSVYMGRPVMIKDEDFDTPLPNVDPVEDREPWQPSLTRDNVSYPPVPGRVMGVFCATARLAVILGAIITQIYPVRTTTGGPSRQAMLADLESRLDQWYITLPEELLYEGPTKKLTPPPQILYLHVRYWGAVLLLHRAFIPNWRAFNERPQRSTVGTRAFDLSHGAACHLASILTQYREAFTMKRSSPFLTSYLLNASIMHILTLTIRPENVEASVALQNCMTALKEMGVIWPSASRAWDLVNGVQLRSQAPALVLSSPEKQYQNTDRNKRDAEDAFGVEKAPASLQREAFAAPDASDQLEHNFNESLSGVQDISTRLMAHMLGLEVPGVEPSTSYYPGYEWWPRMNQAPSQLFQATQDPSYPGNTEFTPDIQAMHPGGNDGNIVGGGTPHWETSNINTSAVEYGLPNQLNYSYDYGQYGV
ncbi:hypothetical protein GALMADRAFT_384548 [Galerina marginata CBS 339.88]|uniref:Zn(2)-C6 fungal-type domain-containing protein n=1 Tax=Galerina marginata (strain CBS 339.88) TaxID=685588 RepID=A0A067TTU5_GALM3|nr:hypothetical protein GALMADRAFT_384548 [Galerina marginata CBS 339.88]